MVIRKGAKAFAWLLSLLVTSTAAAPPMVFVHSGPEAAGDTRQDYYWQLLQAALQANRAQWGDFEVRAHTEALPHQRAVVAVQSGQGPVNIICRGLNDDLEARLLPVMLPLDRGLLGVRLLMVTEATQKKLDALTDPSALKGFTVGQSATWTDVSVLRQGGFNLVLADNYEGLFQMLSAGRFELLPRGLVEIDAEWRFQQTRLPNLRVDQRFLLHYPLSRYFMVARSPEGERMAARIRDGLMQLQRNGGFDRMYNQFKRQLLARQKLKGRIVLRLSNPQLKSEVPLDDPRWWDNLINDIGPSQGPRRTRS